MNVSIIVTSVRRESMRTFTSECERLRIFVLTLVLVVLRETTCSGQTVLRRENVNKCG
jgi:hypothetical protein